MEHNRSAILSCNATAADLLSDVLLQAGYDRPQRSEDLGVAKLARYAPRVLMIDLDHLRSDKLESIRQLRFVLPNCVIAVISSNSERSWTRQCHMAGANGVLCSGGDTRRVLAGLRRAVQTGCYTDSGSAAIEPPYLPDVRMERKRVR
jgi:DNA-binding NarL/FixJ family response regulator